MQTVSKMIVGLPSMNRTPLAGRDRCGSEGSGGERRGEVWDDEVWDDEAWEGEAPAEPDEGPDGTGLWTGSAVFCACGSAGASPSRGCVRWLFMLGE